MDVIDYSPTAKAECTTPPAARGKSEMILGNLLPAFLFQLSLMSKAISLVQRLQSGAGAEPSLVFAASVLQQALTIVFLGFVVALFIVRRPVAGPRTGRLGGIVALAGTFLINVPIGARIAEDNLGLLLGSSLLIVAGLLWSVVSLIYLGRCFGVFPEARGLVTRGPYRWVRHPLYLGELTSALGLVVGTASLAMFGVFLLLCGFQYWRSRLEERALSNAFPEYADYRRQTWGLVPGLR